MPHKQLRIVEKIKFLVSSSVLTKKQIVGEVEKDAQEHRQLNEREEREDDARVDHAQKELRDENELNNITHARISGMLAISIFFNFVFLVAFALLVFFLIYG